jgi:hypothetical protein
MMLLAPGQLQPAAYIGACKKPVEERGSEITYRSVVTFASSGDPVREFARFVNSGTGCSRRKSLAMPRKTVWAIASTRHDREARKKVCAVSFLARDEESL